MGAFPGAYVGQALGTDAAFIVRACNSHDELVSALEAAIPAMGADLSGIDVGAVIANARAALANAKG